MIETKKMEMLETAYSTMILYFSDSVLRKCNKETTAIGLWLKLESLYIAKSLTNRIYLKMKLFGFKMQEDKYLDENFDEFNKLVGKKINDEDQTIILLNSLPLTYSQLRDTIKYGRDTLSLDYLELAIRFKELELRADKKTNSSNEALNVRGRTEKRDNKNKGKSRSKSQRKFRCYHCNKKGHIKR